MKYRSCEVAKSAIEVAQTHRKKIDSQRDKKALQALHIVSVSSRSLVFRNPTSKFHSGWLELDKYSDGEVSIELRDLDSYLLTKEQLDFVQEWILYPYY